MNKEELIVFEQKIADLFNDGQIPYLIHLSGGNEDQLIKIFKDIKPGDYIFSTHRSHYHYLLAGGDPDHLEKEILAGRSMFIFDRELNFYSSSIVCATPAIAAGVALGLKRQGSSQKVWCFIGDGAEDEGHFTEAARYVDGWDLPCNFIIEDNDRSVNATVEERWGKWGCGVSFDCTKEYSYEPTWPHSGTGTKDWIEFKKEAHMEMVSMGSSGLLGGSIETECTYKEAVDASMDILADNGVVFLGYNVGKGDAYGSLKGVPQEQRIETPLAENLMAGLAMGLSLTGIKPVIFFERHDFIYNALDALVNQANIISRLSKGQFNMPIIIKAVAGCTKPFYAGITHTSNLTSLFRHVFDFPVYAPVNAAEVFEAYSLALRHKCPVLISEDKGLY